MISVHYNYNYFRMTVRVTYYKCKQIINFEAQLRIRNHQKFIVVLKFKKYIYLLKYLAKINGYLTL